jgi:hypothetical protein
MKTITIVLAVLALFIQTTKADTTFDGNWTVTVDVKLYVNPDGTRAQPFIFHFPATVQNGFLHGELGTKGKPFWYELSGQIVSGAATFRVDELTGDEKYNFTTSKQAPPGRGHVYSFNVTAHFSGPKLGCIPVIHELEKPK